MVLYLTAALAPPCSAAPSEALPTSANASIGVDAGQLVAALKRDAPARTAYTEVKFSNLFERPLILRGELEYLGPGRLGKRVDSPYQEQTTIANGQASVQRGEAQPRHFDLSRAPGLDGFLRGFAALLGGDAAALRQDFTLSTDGDTAHWRLTLKPRDRGMARRVKAIEVDGSGNAARCFRTREADDDTSVLLVGALAESKLPSRPTPGAIAMLCRGGDAAQ